MSAGNAGCERASPAKEGKETDKKESRETRIRNSLRDAERAAYQSDEKGSGSNGRQRWGQAFRNQ